MLFGDSLPDFAVQFKTKPSEQQRELVEASAEHFGNDWIVLPNAAYGAVGATLDSWNAPLKNNALRAGKGFTTTRLLRCAIYLVYRSYHF